MAFTIATTLTVEAPAQPSGSMAQSAIVPVPANPMEVEAFVAMVRELCGDSSETRAITSALGVELSAAAFSAPDPTTTRLVRCDSRMGKLTLSIGDLAAGSQRELALDVSDVPYAARARTLAVALAETLRLPPSDVSSDSSAVTGPASARGPSEADPNSKGPTSEVHPQHGITEGTVAKRMPAVPQPLPSHGREGLIPVTLRTMVLGPQHTLAAGATVGASLFLGGVRAGANLGYSTTQDRSSLGNARLHAFDIEMALDVPVLRPFADTTVTVGTGAGFYRALVIVESAWGIEEANVQGWFALWDVHSQLTTVLSADVRMLVLLRGVKDIQGLRLRAGGEDAMSLYGFGGELRIGAAYAW